uniref:N-acetyltransferase domain-containing protein n=1 Tax=Anopheles epiroticus TaxID=199890 RepID=A0A182P6W9_9DIPT
MEHTPRTVVNQAHRGAHLLGTPKVSSSSKKSLFGKDAEDETDIGPMTPLRFGSHRRKGQTPNQALSNITSFRNLFGNESPDSDRSLSPDFARRYTNNGRYELLTADHDKENLAHAVDEETRFSFGSSIPETPSSRLSAEESALLDENNSNSLSILMTSDLNLVEKRSKPLHRTPGVTTRSRSTKKANELSIEPLPRRTQLAGAKRANPVGTPDNRSHSPVCTVTEESTTKRANAKARTALHFNDVQPIPAKSFYSSSTVEKYSPVKPVLQPLSTKSFYSSTSSLSQVGASHHKSPDAPNANAPKREYISKTPHKAVTSMRKRSKSFCSTAPRLGQRGTVHKIRKPSKKPSPGVNDSSRTPKRGSKRQKKNRAIAGGTKSCPTTPKSGTAKESDHNEMLQQLKRVNSILRKGQENLKRARPLVISRSMTDLSRAGLSEEEDEPNSSSSEDEELDSEDDDTDAASQRKFFRSKRKSRSIRRVYNHFNSIKVGVQQGGKRKLLSFPQASKRRRTLFADDSFNFDSEQQEVEDLISKLGDGSYVKENGEQAQDDFEEDDAPIPIQSNIIYVTESDELVAEGNPESMEHQQTECGNEMIIVQHDNSETAAAVVPDNTQYVSGGLEYLPRDYETMPAVDQRNDLLSNSIIVVQRDTYHNTTSMIYHNNIATSTTVVQRSTVSQHQCQTQCQAEQVPQQPPSNENYNPATNEYYPIFYTDRVRDLWREEERQQTIATEQQTDVLHLLRQQNNRSKSLVQAGAGRNQYQIDAGQRVYGAVQCKECGLTYSTNEPEEELFHDNFHRSQAKLNFPSGLNEQVVVQVPEWDVTGRIIVVTQVNSTGHQQVLKKAQTVLEMVDNELGYATHGELPVGACVYMAIARSTVLGICVVQPLQYANRMICLEGLHGVPIDCYSSEFYPARCGISRIWVAPKYRRHGIGRKLVTSVRYHYIFGYAMKADEIAFGAPTEVGKLFAEAICGRKDFLVFV